MSWPLNQSPAWSTQNESGSTAAAAAAVDAPASMLDAFLTRLPRQRTAAQTPGQALYLLGWNIVVVPHQRTAGWWHCVVISGGPAYPPGATVLASDLDLETALAARVADPLADLPAATFTAVWQARATVLRPGRPLAAVCRVLAEDLRQPTSRHVQLDDNAKQHLAHRAGIDAAGLRRLLRNLCDSGLLRPDQTDQDPRGYTLTLPPVATQPRPRMRPVTRRAAWAPQPPRAHPDHDTRL